MGDYTRTGIPVEVIDACAKAYYEADKDLHEGGWDAAIGLARDEYRKVAELILETARAMVIEPDMHRFHEALVEIAENRHHFRRPAGAIAKAALDGRPLPPMHPCGICGGSGISCWTQKGPVSCTHCDRGAERYRASVLEGTQKP